MQALLLELVHRLHGLQQLGRIASLLGGAHQGLHISGEAGAAVAAAGPDELKTNARVGANAIAAGFSRSELRTRSMSAPRRSAKLASSFMNEILVASMALAAYLVSSAERTSITTMRSWLRLKGAYSAYGSTSSPDCAYIASMAARLLLGADEIRHRSTRSRQGAGTCRGSLSR
jgi:hypothetical protein